MHNLLCTHSLIIKTGTSMGVQSHMWQNFIAGTNTWRSLAPISHFSWDKLNKTIHMWRNFQAKDDNSNAKHKCTKMYLILHAPQFPDTFFYKWSNNFFKTIHRDIEYAQVENWSLFCSFTQHTPFITAWHKTHSLLSINFAVKSGESAMARRKSICLAPWAHFFLY